MKNGAMHAASGTLTCLVGVREQDVEPRAVQPRVTDARRLAVLKSNFAIHLVHLHRERGCTGGSEERAHMEALQEGFERIRVKLTLLVEREGASLDASSEHRTDDVLDVGAVGAGMAAAPA